MGLVVYTSCALAALACALLLARAYERTGSRLLLWSTLCFACLTVNNALIVVDLVLLPDVNLFVARNLAALSGMAVLLYGLIWDSK